jgi:CRISPR-associated helicase Cas3
LGTISRYLHLPASSTHALLSAWAADKLLDGATHGLSDKQKMQVLCAIEGHHTNLDHAMALSPVINRDCAMHTPTCRHFRNSQLDMVENLRNFHQLRSGNEYNNLLWQHCFNEFAQPVSIQGELTSTNTDFITDFLESGIIFSALLQADRGYFAPWTTPQFDITFDTQPLAAGGGPLAGLRTEFHTHALNTHDFGAGVTVIHAPTGIGKTRVFLDLVNRYCQNNNFERVFYFSPLLALTDDFEEKITRVVDPADLDDIIMYNHLFSATLAERQALGPGQFGRYHKDFLYKSFNQKFIIATTQRLLMMIYSNGQEGKMKLVSLKNSLLILDEVQTLPKFLIPNFIQILQQIATCLNSRILLVSATIPAEIANANLPTTSPTVDLTNRYLNATSKRIAYANQLPTLPTSGKLLVMANIRKKARDIYEQLETSHPNTELRYITAGVRKRDRKEIINTIPRDSITVSTQAIEAGVDISFDSIYREVAPLDSIVQVMGRLDREGLNPNATLTVYRNRTHPERHPYTELEWNESHTRIQQIHNSQELYRELPGYYNTVFAANATNQNLAVDLRDLMIDLDFPNVWRHVRQNIGDIADETVFIPDDAEWDTVKRELLDEDTRGAALKRYSTLTAGLPRTTSNLDYDVEFDPDLMQHNILLPRRNRLANVYDDDRLGLDIWLR